jgi:hypothetical protein
MADKYPGQEVGAPHDASKPGAHGAYPSPEASKTSRIRKWLGGSIRSAAYKKNKTPTEKSAAHATDSKGATGGEKSLGPRAKSALGAAGKVIGALNFADDAIMYLQIFCDSFFYNAFPDESTLITAHSLEGIKKKCVKKQIDSTTEYNVDIDRSNADLVAAGYSDYREARGMWPVIMGPLDSHDKQAPLLPRPTRYPEYELQMRVQAEVDAVRERLLRTTFKQAWLDSCGTIDDYNDIIADPADALVNYVDGYLLANTSDELYRQAFSNVCAFSGGVVYEDIRPASDPVWHNRPRFQCGWATPELCWTAGKSWMAQGAFTGGNYAEWFTFGEMDDAIDLLANETPPPASTGGTIPGKLTGCWKGASASTSTAGTPAYSDCKFGLSHPYATAGHTGACMVTTSAIASMCTTNEGTYSIETHTCEFSEKYCQSIGTCFDKTNKVCHLPPEAMEGLSMIFGTGGPREWIKINGCNFISSPEKTFENIISVTPLGLFTKSGQTFLSDMIANNKNWNEGLKNTLGNPMMIAMLSSMVVAEFAAEAGAMLIFGTATAAQTAGVSLLVMAIAIGFTYGIMTMQSNNAQNRGPPDPTYGPFAAEYTVGGWHGSAPITLGFNNGWVTKPLKAHYLDNPSWPPPAQSPTAAFVPPTPRYPSSMSEFPGVNRIEFYCTLDGVDVNTYCNMHEPPVCKNMCYQRGMIRGGADSGANNTWCIPPFPGGGYADTNNIGTLAPDPVTVNMAADGTTTTTAGAEGQSRAYSTSNAWTSGMDPNIAQYPSDTSTGGTDFNVSNGNNPGAWYYQLSYDKGNMVGMVDDPDHPGIKMGFPTHLWNTDLLRYYFLDTTIQEMRQHYCLHAFYDHPDGTGIPSQCWGYLNISISDQSTATTNPTTGVEITPPTKYNFIPMSIPGQMMSSADPVFCSAPQVFNSATNTCITPPSRNVNAAGRRRGGGR